jgi:ketosteroid isomerase-like protein
MRTGLVLAVPFLLLAPLSSQTRTDPTLTKMAADFAAAFNAKDADKIGSYYADDATLMPPNQPAVRGRENIQAWFKGGMDEGYANFQLTPTESSVAGAQAFEAGTYSLDMKPKGSGGAASTDKGKYVVVYKRIAGQWKLAYDIFNSDLPPTPAAK